MYLLTEIRNLTTRGSEPDPWAGGHPCRIWWRATASNRFPLRAGNQVLSYNGKPSLGASQRLLKLWTQAVTTGAPFNLSGYIYDRKNLICSVSYVDGTSFTNAALWPYYFTSGGRPSLRFLSSDEMQIPGSYDICVWPFLNTPVRSRVWHTATELATVRSLTGRSRISYTYSRSYAPYGNPRWGHSKLTLPRFIAMEKSLLGI